MAARFQLLDERRRYVTRHRGDHDHVEGCVLGPAVVAVADTYVYVRVAEPLEASSRSVAERLDDLDREDVLAQLAQYRGLIARSGAELVRAAAGTRLDQVRHDRDDVGL